LIELEWFGGTSKAGFAAITTIDYPPADLECVVVKTRNAQRVEVDDLQKDAEKNTPHAALAHYSHGCGSRPKLFSDHGGFSLEATAFGGILLAITGRLRA
jgi:hypothetical protein